MKLYEDLTLITKEIKILINYNQNKSHNSNIKI